MPFLSICIPTYNQPIAVERLLNSISNQWRDNLEIIVCDDSNNQDTKIVVSEYSRHIPIKYIQRNRAGLDRAVIDLVRMANGDYIWWVGDDNILPNGIDNVFGFLEQVMPDFLWVNSCDAFDTSLVTFPIKNDVVTYNPNDFLIFDVGLLGFITATIFKRGVAAKHLDSATAHNGSAWVCLYLILCVVTSGGKLSILKTPCFSSFPKPSGEVRWYDQFQVFGINLLHIVLEFQKSFDKAKLRTALNNNLVRVLKAVLVERAMGYKTGFASPSPKLIPLFVNYYQFLQFWVYLPLLMVPPRILNILYAIYKKRK